MVKVENINKIYGENSGNLNINFQINDGDIFAILGPNGAGKTTLIRQILGFIKPDNGSISVDGLDSWSQRQEIMNFTSYIPGESTLTDHLTGKQYLKLVSSLKANADKKYLEYLIGYFEIDTRTKIKKMSKGMKQKIAIIAALLGKPKFLVLDEPTSGLDAVMQLKFIDIIKDFSKNNNATVLICSHILEEVSSLANRVAFLKDGRIVEQFELEKNDTKKLNETFIKLFPKKEVV